MKLFSLLRSLSTCCCSSAYVSSRVRPLRAPSRLISYWLKVECRDSENRSIDAVARPDDRRAPALRCVSPASTADLSAPLAAPLVGVALPLAPEQMSSSERAGWMSSKLERRGCWRGDSAYAEACSALLLSVFEGAGCDDDASEVAPKLHPSDETSAARPTDAAAEDAAGCLERAPASRY